MSNGTEKTVNQFSEQYFALQIDKFTHISRITHIIGFALFFAKNKTVNQFLCRGQLTEYIIQQVNFDSFLSYVSKFNIICNQLIGKYTEGTLSMVGSIKGYITFSKKKMLNHTYILF